MKPRTLDIRLAAVKKKVPLINLLSTETPQLITTGYVSYSSTSILTYLSIRVSKEYIVEVPSCCYSH